jgi:hypothetical protein
MANDTNRPSIDSREKGPLHRPDNAIDAGKANSGNENSIGKPSRDMHTVNPAPGNEAEGQTTKM